jgi:AcrR family transcriptional regulator
VRADAEANRRDLLATAARLITEHGANVSLRSVAQEAGVGIGTLYRHFPTREDLVVALAQTAADEIDAATARFLTSTGDVATRWATLVADVGLLDLGALGAGLREAEPDLPRQEQIAERRAAVVARLAEVLAVAAAHGLVAADVTPVRLMSGFAAVTRPLPDLAGTASLPDERAWLLQVYLRGLRPEPR